MSYLLKSNRGNGKKIAKPVIVIISFIVIAFLVKLAFSGFFPGFAHFLAKPLWSGKSAISEDMKGISGFFSSKNALLGENEALKQEIQNDQVKILSFDMLVQENTELKLLWSRKSGAKPILAAVLSAPPISPYDTLVIDAGSKDGVKKGAKVFVQDKILLGEVSEVMSNTSVVRLYSTPGQKTSLSLDKSKTPIDAVGAGGGNFTARLPKEAGVEKGDLVFLPGLDKLILGEVLDVETNANDSFEDLLIRIPVNMLELNFVQVELL